jgi:hypothetical protein
MQTTTPETMQGLKHETRAESPPPQIRSDPNVLNSAEAFFTKSLNRRARAIRPDDQPSRFGYKFLSRRDISHQLQTSGQTPQTREDLDIHFASETPILDVCMALEKMRRPALPKESFRQNGQVSNLPQIALHAVTLEEGSPGHDGIPPPPKLFSSYRNDGRISNSPSVEKPRLFHRGSFLLDEANVMRNVLGGDLQ